MKYSDVIVMLLIAVVMFLGGLFVGMNYPYNSFTFTVDYEKEPSTEVIPSYTPQIEQPQPAPSPVPVEPEPELPEPSVSEIQGGLVKEWSGTGLKVTENFIIAEAPWAIEWVNIPEKIDGQSVGMLKILVYQVDNPSMPPMVAANTMEEMSDTSYIEQTGKFFLIINGFNTSWTVTVIEPQ
jgi:hypothetical protein